MKNASEVFQALSSCDVLSLAFHGGEYPYVVPLNFGAERTENGAVLYFHCAAEGAKLNCLAQNPCVGFCAYRLFRVFGGESPCSYTADYESVCGKGRAEIVTDEKERLHGLRVLLSHYTGRSFDDRDFDLRALSLTAVVKISVLSLTGKRLIGKER